MNIFYNTIKNNIDQLLFFVNTIWYGCGYKKEEKAYQGAVA
jgi:hypothetical protein